MSAVLFLGIIPADRLPGLLQPVRALVPSSYATDALAGALGPDLSAGALLADLSVCLVVAVASLAWRAWPSAGGPPVSRSTTSWATSGGGPSTAAARPGHLAAPAAADEAGPRARDDAGAGLVTAVALVLLGAPAGLVWALVSPRVSVLLSESSATLAGTDRDVFIAGDGAYLGVVLVAGLLSGAVAAVLGRRHGTRGGARAHGRRPGRRLRRRAHRRAARRRHRAGRRRRRPLRRRRARRAAARPGGDARLAGRRAGRLPRAHRRFVASRSVRADRRAGQLGAGVAPSGAAGWSRGEDGQLGVEPPDDVGRGEQALPLLEVEHDRGGHGVAQHQGSSGSTGRSTSSPPAAASASR
jgi:hypothetical protein